MAEFKIAVVGLGYVGLPLLCGLANHFDVVGFDVSESRCEQLRSGVDITNEVDGFDNNSACINLISSNPSILDGCNIFIVCVPTPVLNDYSPDLDFLRSACELIAPLLKPGSGVIFESTVYPGCTENFCAPILQCGSDLTVWAPEIEGQADTFYIGYSPERINPGDGKHRLENTPKIISSPSDAFLDRMDLIYGKVLSESYTVRSSTIKNAEAAKVIENTQRDINIGFVNELSIVFSELGLDTLEILDLAKTKWNFLDFRPGLVGGHCISVDPYYLASIARAHGIKTDMILSARSTNNGMAKFYASYVDDFAEEREHCPRTVVVFGATFKENVPDCRNSGSLTLGYEFERLGYGVSFFDPVLSEEDADALGINRELPAEVGIVILSVAHEAFVTSNCEFVKKFLSAHPQALIFDLKGFLTREDRDLFSDRLIRP